MRLRDHHEQEILTGPSPRPFSCPTEHLLLYYQLNRRCAGLLHNHPSGDPTPSQEDIAMTLEIVTVAKPLGISVHDHIIVGKDGHASLKGLRLI